MQHSMSKKSTGHKKVWQCHVYIISEHWFFEKLNLFKKAVYLELEVKSSSNFIILATNCNKHHFLMFMNWMYVLSFKIIFNVLNVNWHPSHYPQDQCKFWWKCLLTNRICWGFFMGNSLLKLGTDLMYMDI